MDLKQALDQWKALAKETLKDTVAFYSEDPQARRSVKGTVCLYNGPNDTQCAASRLLTEEGRHKAQEGASADMLPVASFQTKYQPLAKSNFLLELQRLHDTAPNWGDWIQEGGKGLTTQGEEAVRVAEKLIEITDTLPIHIHNRIEAGWADPFGDN